MRKLLMFVLLFLENAFGILLGSLLVVSIRDFVWSEFFSIYVAYAVVSFVGYCLGRAIGLAKKLRFTSMLKGLVIAPLFYYYLIIRQIWPSRSDVAETHADSKPEKTQKTNENVSSEQAADTRKKDIGKGKAQSLLARIEYDTYRANQRYNTVKFVVKKRLKVSIGLGNKIDIESGVIQVIVDVDENGEICSPGEVAVQSFISEIKREVDDSIKSQIEDAIEELQKEYSNYDDLKYSYSAHFNRPYNFH